MCTVTIIRNRNSLDLYMNRDERHERKQEKPPAHHWDNDILAPLDPQSNGTWIAVNTKTKNWGALLNGYTNTAPTNPIKSRGQILLNLLKEHDPEHELQAMELNSFASFKIIVNAKLFHWDGETLKQKDFHAQNGESFFETSSSYKQNEVIEIRKTLFENWMENGKPLNENGIPALHVNPDPNPETAILMHRDYSRTKSITHLHIGEGAPAMTCFLHPADQL
ncbi:MAG: NRDE family protein [Bdellovibrionales bacterium]